MPGTALNQPKCVCCACVGPVLLARNGKKIAACEKVIQEARENMIK